MSNVLGASAWKSVLKNILIPAGPQPVKYDRFAQLVISYGRYEEFPGRVRYLPRVPMSGVVYGPGQRHQTYNVQETNTESRRENTRSYSGIKRKLTVEHILRLHLCFATTYQQTDAAERGTYEYLSFV